MKTKRIAYVVIVVVLLMTILACSSLIFAEPTVTSIPTGTPLPIVTNTLESEFTCNVTVEVFPPNVQWTLTFDGVEELSEDPIAISIVDKEMAYFNYDNEGRVDKYTFKISRKLTYTSGNTYLVRGVIINLPSAEKELYYDITVSGDALDSVKRCTKGDIEDITRLASTDTPELLPTFTLVPTLPPTQENSYPLELINGVDPVKILESMDFIFKKEGLQGFVSASDCAEYLNEKMNLYAFVFDDGKVWFFVEFSDKVYRSTQLNLLADVITGIYGDSLGERLNSWISENLDSVLKGSSEVADIDGVSVHMLRDDEYHRLSILIVVNHSQ